MCSSSAGQNKKPFYPLQMKLYVFFPVLVMEPLGDDELKAQLLSLHRHRIKADGKQLISALY